MNKKGAKEDCITAQDYRDQIALNYKNHKYYDGYILAQELLDRINRNTIIFSQNDKYAVYGNLSIGCRRLNMIKKSIYYAKLSLKYAETLNEFINSKITLAIGYQTLGDKNRAIIMYDNGIEMCDTTIREMEWGVDKARILECKANLLTNRGDLTEDEKYIFEGIEIYHKIRDYYLSIDDNIRSELIDGKINKGYYNICEIYLNNKAFLKFQKILLKITDKEIKNKLRNKMFQQSKVVNIL